VSESERYLRELAERGYRDEDLQRFLAAWDHVEGAFLERLAEACAGSAEWRECFRAGAAEIARLVEEHRPQARFIVVDALGAGELGRRRQRALGALLAEKLDRARAELDDPERVPQATGPWIVALFFDRAYRRCSGGGTGPDLPSQLPELTFLAVSAYFGTEAGLAELFPPA
jgi:hypothetical protein